jgi:hypothetical protein
MPQYAASKLACPLERESSNDPYPPCLAPLEPRRECSSVWREKQTESAGSSCRVPVCHVHGAVRSTRNVSASVNYVEHEQEDTMDIHRL